MDLRILNEKQKEAVLCTKNPLLVIAGAGSGKTRVITYKTAYLIEQGVNPFNILAITFTNKASQEMHERITKLLKGKGANVWVSTFHKMCAGILRRHIDKIGYSLNFSIYDTEDSQSVIKSIIKNMDLDSKMYKEKAILSKISSYKNRGENWEDMEKDAHDPINRNYVKIFKSYEQRMFEQSALDFDDLLLKTIELFRQCPDVLEHYNNRFKYILVDEYQDTNLIQFDLVYLLSLKSEHLCVVGDDDQSIYKFRGADIQNILSFEEMFSKARTIKLEQNYRSTKNILDCANSVIKHNSGRKSKVLWTKNEEGTKIRYKLYPNSILESADTISEIKKNKDYKNTVILYRTNAQSRLFEEQCVKHSIPYRLVGGVNFYQRREIKDMLSYLRLLCNPEDEISFTRIINVPKRGIGLASIQKITDYARSKNLPILDSLQYSNEMGLSNSTVSAINNFYNYIQNLINKDSIQEIMESIKNDTGYAKSLLLEEGEILGQERLENIDEFINKAVDYTENAESPSLVEFLQEVSLVADVDSYNENEEKLTLMTLHGSKGLEFDNVYISGLMEGLFPSYMAISSGNVEDIEEERRLCYVGITRARKNLYLSSSKQRMLNGSTQECQESRFIDEIDSSLLHTINASGSFGRDNFSSSMNSNNRKNFYGRTGHFQEDNSKEYNKKYDDFFESSRYYRAVTENIDNIKRQETIKKSNNELAARIKKASSINKPKLNYKEGDKVKHIKFGIGKVKSITDIGKDYEVSVEFKSCGTKILLAAYAKLEKVNN